MPDKQFILILLLTDYLSTLDIKRNMTEQEIKKFKAALKKNGQSLTWFHGKYLKQKITRNAMYLQLDKGRPSEDVQKAIRKYLTA